MLYDHNAVDSICEREARAILRLERLTGRKQPQDPIREARRIAADPRSKPIRFPRYPRGAYLRRWFAALACIDAGKPVPRTRLDRDTHADLERRRQQKHTFGRVVRQPTPRGRNGKFCTAA